MYGVNSAASQWLRELDYCLVKQGDNGIIAFGIQFVGGFSVSLSASRSMGVE